MMVVASGTVDGDGVGEDSGGGSGAGVAGINDCERGREKEEERPEHNRCYLRSAFHKAADSGNATKPRRIKDRSF
ncbi:hypothetical protein V1477_009008 [Vespula maculifrons]|uniref:Uncharacterized protein n=1 Tax=Vespula maculifrons TaxID=7453 RepID=A0ABD2CFL5_VESMC